MDGEVRDPFADAEAAFVAFRGMDIGLHMDIRLIRCQHGAFRFHLYRLEIYEGHFEVVDGIFLFIADRILLESCGSRHASRQ